MGGLPSDSPSWALLADDLSGACDSAVAFAKAGFRTRLELGEPRAGVPAELTAFSTETREAHPEEAAEAVRQACQATRRAGLQLIFKKIDSVLRGPVEAEIRAALDATEFETAVVCPSFPSQGRQVRGGRLVVHGEVRDALPQGPGLEPRDALTDADLGRLAAELLERPTALPVGSGGLAAAWARALGRRSGRAPAEPPPPRSDLVPAFYVGSQHPASVEQMGCLERIQKPHLLVRVDMNVATTDLSSLISILEHDEIGSLLLSGGATARRILEGLLATAIEVRGEAVSGAPWGTIIGGVADGLTVVTKSGGFGGPTALADILDTLTQS